jgi:FkbM family methyltransferase
MVMARVSNCATRIKEFVRWRFLKPILPKVPLFDGLIYLGSEYGGKLFLDTELNDKSQVVCAGAGLDISFEVEVANKYQCNVFVLDPTPKSLSYLSEVKSRIGMGPEVSYLKGSFQPVESYDLREINFEKLKFLPYALWKSQGELDFYAGVSERDISMSALGIHSYYSEHTQKISVPCISLQYLTQSFGISRIDLLKLDVEGAALEILGTLKNIVLPRQIILEFDEAHFPSVRSILRVLQIRFLLSKLGYSPIGRFGYDFTYLLRQK